MTATQEEYGLSVEAARQLGVVVSEEGAASIASMNDALGRVEKGMEGLYNQVAIAVAPAVESIADAIVEWVPPLVDIGTTALPIMVDSLTVVAGYAVDIVNVLGRLQAYDFSGAASLATNMQTADAWLEQVNQRREEAETRAAAAAQQRKAEQEAAAQLAQAALERSAQSGAKPAEDLIKSLERQLEVAREGEEAVRRQEQLALARNDAERDRIAILQEQIKQQELENEIARRIEAHEKQKREQEERDEQRRQEKLKQPTQLKAFESRLLSRGPDTTAEQMQRVQQQGVAVAQQQLGKMDEIVRAIERNGTGGGPAFEFVG